ncbi:CCA tRNA nucleotidyltransferase [Liquorilactobacillus mali]|uniref:CCA-adding enzyme n=1 Tax=Liquorilactobacillus mali KCTC 3596 = DSM 20444 TaxID=1046596 RepID=J0UQW8_9LACO|nr:CCA tRNA nucleotidyltransferase [Liquorilactobacillus mali]EJE98469.1 tRNA CCA-pyrophosphorylase [Liquorilactobacillus mali KCTC 3596 = DSM 20444]KRN08577.1 tRNA CCA-pyrophosphorylase [Liquorilactobacillus mali KCTC 3596 = DSM 20444]MDC7952171.1 CCA tRNA nucleotidyltransferase [Liquorilactobacillus mali]QFQ74740.1 CCA tRNA nucleotidyltransferase [Liquorilactobacillus mali]
MKLIKLPLEFQKARIILEKIHNAGFEAYFVGGSVRDTLLGLPLHDVDIATSAYPAEIKQIFRKTVDTGIEHGTVTVLDHGDDYEVTTFRTESTYQDYRRPDSVQFVRSLKDDLKRRDLTINALALSLNGEIIDLFGGLEDLKKGLIKAVGNPNERYHEDALRMMRTVRFASQLDFEIETTTLEAVTNNAHLLEKIAVERINVEWIKLLLGKNPKKGIVGFLDTKLFVYCPLFNTMEQVLKTMLSLEQLHFSDDVAAWTLFCYLALNDHKQIRKLLKAWKCSNELIANVQSCFSALELLKTNQFNAWNLYTLGLPAFETANLVANMLGFARDIAAIQSNYESLPIKNKKELAVNGGNLIKDLQFTPGPLLGKVLAEIEKQVVCGKLKNELASLEKAALKIKNNQ